jgi:hypothetical protein
MIAALPPFAIRLNHPLLKLAHAGVAILAFSAANNARKKYERNTTPGANATLPNPSPKAASFEA